MTEKSIVGDLINFRGLVYAPLNENGVIFLFGKVADDLNMYIEEIKPGFPDCIGRRFIGKGWERVAIEFEYQSQNFKQHGHDHKKCDIIICWEHNWDNCPIEVIELKSEIQSMSNPPIEKPGKQKQHGKLEKESLEILYNNVLPGDKVKEWLSKLLDLLPSEIDSVWAKIGTKYIGIYSPERAFASFLLRKNSIHIEAYCGKTLIEGTKVSNQRFSPRWCKLILKSDNELEKTISILKESHKRIKRALKSGETTGYYSGGEFSSTKQIDDLSQDE
jgi:hypothetical protein